MGKKFKSKSVASILVIALLLNIFAGFADIFTKTSYAENLIQAGRTDGKDITSEYIPSFSFANNFENWTKKARRKDTGEVGEVGSKKSNGFYPIQLKKGQEIGVDFKSLSGNRAEIKVGPIKNIEGKFYSGLFRTDSVKELKENNIYKVSMDNTRNGVNKNGKIDLIYLKGSAQEIIDGSDKSILDQLYNLKGKNDWKYLEDKTSQHIFIGDNARLRFDLYISTGNNTSPENDMVTNYTLSNLKLSDITPASQASIDTSQGVVGKKVLKGSVSKYDDNEKRTSFKGDQVKIKIGDEVFTATVKEDNTWELNLENPIAPNVEIEYQVLNPDSDNRSPVKKLGYVKEDHTPKVDELVEGKKEVNGTGYPGDEILITDEDGKELGKGKVDEDGNFTVDLNRPLAEGEVINIEAKSGENIEKIEKVVNKDEHKPQLEGDIKEGDKSISGKGQPGDEIVITDQDGKELGRGKVDENGDFKVDLNRPLEEGEKITLTPETDGEKGSPLEKDVEFNKQLHKPNIENAKEGEKLVTGTGIPGDTIVIRDSEGSELGRGEVGDDGKFEIELDRELVEKEEITAQAEKGENKSDETKVTVTYEAKAHKPELNEAKEGDISITGKGTPGDTIVITDEEGNELGRGEVGDDGSFEINVENPLKPGKIIATPITDGNEGETAELDIDLDKELHKPKVDDDLKEGDTSITGKGQPGDEIIVKDKDGNELGKGTVDENGDFTVELDRPLKDGEKITLTPDTDGIEGDSLKKDVIFNKELHKPNIENAKEGEKIVTGTGIPGDTIVIRDSEGIELGRGEVGTDGKFKIGLDRELVEKEEITAQAEKGENKSDETKVTVTYEAKAHKPELNEAKEGDTSITGKGTPGDTIVITDEEGNELGRGEVGDDGSFEINVENPLRPGKIIATPITGDNEGEPDELDIDLDKEKHKPEVDADLKEGDTSITGKGQPGDEIIVKDKDGNELGKGTVDEDGNFTVDLDRPLKDGEKITLTPETDGKEGDSLEKDVEFNKDLHKPEVEVDLKEGDTSITGKGQPGDEIIVKDKDGNELGKGKVDEDGNFKIDLDKPLEEGKIELIPKTDDKEGSPLEKEVEYNPEYHKPEVDQDPKEGDTSISGKGVPGDEIVITDKDGNVLGKGTVDEDGNFKIELDRPLEESDELVLKPNTNGKEGTPLELGPAEYNKELHKPNIEKAIGGEEKVTGTGIEGDNIIITDEKGKELGKGTVDKDGNFNINLTRPLEEGEKIKAQAVDGDNKSEETEVQVTYNASNHKPTLNTAKEGDTKVTGTGIPGDEIIVKDKDGNELGRGKVDKDGKFEITVAPLMVGKLTAIPVTNGNEGEEGEGEVDYNPEAHKPNIEKAKEGEREVTGKGVPGDEIVITDKDGNELGKGTVDKDGNFKIEIDRPLKEGEEVTAKAKTGDKESEDTKVTVSYEAEKHKPKLDPVEEGDKKLTGTGTPGDEIIVKDKDGNELGRGKVDKDGKFEINLDKPLKPGKITATPVTNGNEGESLTLTVDKKPSEPEIPVEPIDPEPPFDKDKHKPEVEEIYDGDKIVSGKGVPGDTITIVDENGKEIGKTQVDKNGNFKVELTRPVKEGEVIVVRPNTDGNKGTESTLTVRPKKEENIYDKLNSEDHIAYIQGFEDGTVRPESTVTREQVSAVLYRLLKPSYRDTIKTTKTSFKDVGPKRWSRKHIATLENGKIINGTGYGNFSPARNITKAELVVMLSRLEKLDTRPNNDFTDIKGHWAEAEIKSAANKGWINGHGNNKFQPDKHLTRAEFVTMINNVLNRKVEKKDILPEAKSFKDLKKDKWYYEAMMEAINSHHYERKDNGFEKWTDIYYPNLDM